MSESRVEQLLSKMILSEPSSELDERIASSLSAVPAVLVSRSDRAVSWGMLAAVAVVCLVIGAVAGQALNGVAVAENEELRPDTGNEKPAGEIFGKAGEEFRAMNMRIIPVPEQEALWNQIQGPPVTMLCALKTGGLADASGREQCLQCHSGLPDAESRFRQQHMLDSKFSTCTWCHESPERSDGR